MSGATRAVVSPGAEVEFEWDETKRQQNLCKHGLDFLNAPKVFRGAHVTGRATTVMGEERWLAIGLALNRPVTIVYTVREGRIRVISMRRARDNERERYQAIHGS